MRGRGRGRQGRHNLSNAAASSAPPPVAIEPPRAAETVKYNPQELYADECDPRGAEISPITDFDHLVVKYSDEFLSSLGRIDFGSSGVGGSDEVHIGQYVTEAVKGCPSYFPLSLLGRPRGGDPDGDRTSRLASLFLTKPKRVAGGAGDASSVSGGSESGAASSSTGGTDAASAGQPDDDDENDYAEGGGEDDEPSW